MTDYDDEKKPPQDEYSDAQNKWTNELQASHKELEDFHSRGDKILDFYLDDRKLRRTKRYPLFNTNVGILENALFARIPRPDVSRRFKDPDDHVGRVASLILQRALVTELEGNTAFKTTAKSVIKDMLVVGLGVAWNRYDADVESPQVTDDEDKELADEVDASPVVKDEQTPIDYVHWKDFRYSPCRTWNECRWVARRVYMDEDEAAKRFGERAEWLSFATSDHGTGGSTYRDINSDGDKEPQHNVEPQAQVWEIWNKSDKKVYWVCEECPTALDIKDDPLGLPEFFPTDRPLVANFGTSNFVPYADYTQLQDQYRDLEETNNRISRLVKACRLAGVYDSSEASIKLLLEGTAEHQLVPIKNFTGFAEKGGLKGALDFLPLENIVGVIGQLNAHREATKAQIYELTGISDIVRGETNPYETKGAQAMKAQYASIRLQGKQDDTASYLTAAIKNKAFLMLKFYSSQRLMERCGMLPQFDQQFVQPALQLLQNELLTSLKLEVSTDALQQPNWARDQAERAQTVTSLGQLLAPIMQQVPGALEALAPLYAHIVKWSIAGSSGAREIEGMLDMGLQQLQQKQAQPEQPQGPSPEQQAAQQAQEQAQRAEQQAMQAAQAKQQLEANKQQADQQKAVADFNLKRDLAKEELALKREIAFEELSLKREVETAKAAQKQVPQLVAGNMGLDEDRLIEVLSAMQQQTVEAVSAVGHAVTAAINQPQEPVQITVARNPDGSLSGTLQ